MIDDTLARTCPRPTNLGAWLFLTLGLGTLVTIATTLAAPMSGMIFGACWTPAAPNPLPGALCATLSVLLVLLPVWALLPPTRRAVEQNDAQLVWDRPMWPTTVRVCGTMLALLMLGSLTSAVQSQGVQWFPEPDESCAAPPYSVSAQVRERQTMLFQWSVAAGLGTQTLVFWASSTLRPRGRIRLDDLGLELDGARWSYKDIEKAEVRGGVLRFERYDGERYEVELFSSEHAFAERLVDTVSARRPTQVEERAGARAALTHLARSS